MSVQVTPPTAVGVVVQGVPEGLASAPWVRWDGVAPQPSRPITAADIPVIWDCPIEPTGGGTPGGGGMAVTGLDLWLAP